MAASLYPDTRIVQLSRHGNPQPVASELFVEYFAKQSNRSPATSGQRLTAASDLLRGRIYSTAMSFEKNLSRLDEIVAQLEGDKLDLNTSLKLFEEGVELLRLASEELNEAEEKVKELVERADGVLELRDLRP
jgi:exodeoxyribonuclease VII small subunit